MVCSAAAAADVSSPKEPPAAAAETPAAADLPPQPPLPSKVGGGGGGSRSRKISRLKMKSSSSTETAAALDTTAAAMTAASGGLGGLKKNKKQSNYKRSLSLNAKLHSGLNKGNAASMSSSSPMSASSFADIAVANYTTSKKTAATRRLKEKARTVIWIRSLKEKALMIESMLQNLQILTVRLKRSHQLSQQHQQNSLNSMEESSGTNSEDDRAIQILPPPPPPVLHAAAATTSGCLGNQGFSSNLANHCSASREGAATAAAAVAGARLDGGGNNNNSGSRNSECIINNGDQQQHGSNAETEAIVVQIAELEASVKSMRATLLLVCRNRLMDKQIGLLLSVQKQMYPTFDISVRFFGIDWHHIFNISHNLVQRVQALSDALLLDDEAAAAAWDSSTHRLQSGAAAAAGQSGTAAAAAATGAASSGSLSSGPCSYSTISCGGKGNLAGHSKKRHISSTSSFAANHVTANAWISGSSGVISGGTACMSGGGGSSGAISSSTAQSSSIQMQASDRWIDSNNKCSNNNRYIDILLPSNILRDLATIEADVNSHCEAVLNNRLSKSNRDRILREQRRLVVLNSNASRGSDLPRLPSSRPASPSSKAEMSSSCRSLASMHHVANPTAADDHVVLDAPNGNGSGDAAAALHVSRAKSTGNLLSGGMRKLKQALKFGSSRGSLNSALQRQYHDTLWGAWYSGLQQTVTVMPPYFGAAATAATAATSAASGASGGATSSLSYHSADHILLPAASDSSSCCPTAVPAVTSSSCSATTVTARSLTSSQQQLLSVENLPQFQQKRRVLLHSRSQEIRDDHQRMTLSVSNGGSGGARPKTTNRPKSSLSGATTAVGSCKAVDVTADVTAVIADVTDESSGLKCANSNGKPDYPRKDKQLKNGGTDIKDVIAVSTEETSDMIVGKADLTAQMADGSAETADLNVQTADWNDAVERNAEDNGKLNINIDNLIVRTTCQYLHVHPDSTSIPSRSGDVEVVTTSALISSVPTASDSPRPSLPGAMASDLQCDQIVPVSASSPPAAAASPSPTMTREQEQEQRRPRPRHLPRSMSTPLGCSASLSMRQRGRLERGAGVMEEEEECCGQGAILLSPSGGGGEMESLELDYYESFSGDEESSSPMRLAFNKGGVCGLQPSSFGQLVAGGDGEVAYIDNEDGGGLRNDQDLGDDDGDLLEWLTLHDAPRQSKADSDL